MSYDVPGNKASLFHARLICKDPIPRITVGPCESGCDFSMVLRDRQNGEAGSAKSLFQGFAWERQTVPLGLQFVAIDGADDDFVVKVGDDTVRGRR